MKTALLALCISTLSLTACSKPEPKEDQTAPVADQQSIEHSTQPASSASNLPQGDTAETSLDWHGEYKGVLPCADCEGIATELELNSDKTYELTEKYLGKGDGQESKIKGTFQFDQTHPSIITLDTTGHARKFFVAENYLESRNFTTGEKIDGPLAEHYILKKNP